MCCVVWCVVVVVVFLVVLVVCKCVFVCVATRLKKSGEPHFKNASVCTCKMSLSMPAPTRTCVETCTRSAGTHGDVLNVHGDVLSPHTEGCKGSSSVLLTTICPRMAIKLIQRFTKETNKTSPLSSLGTDGEQHVPNSSHYSLHLINLPNYQRS